MYVEKLDIFGFKSFANRTEVPLARGITAIVGPNGCGKSNISDAFRWALGEQNARTLRGEKLQDVIFKGSGAAKALGMAEVSLTVCNDDGTLPLEYTHVSVTRRVYRSGESEFAINKLPCRLKDIRDLFSGTGMGSHGYAVIERDMVDQVLSDKDDARRFLFEEAAGIIRYKQRRRESERRLEGVELDLTRIEDMIREIERGVRSLSRQAGKVRRWRRLKEELDRHEVFVAWEQWRLLRTESLSFDDVHRRREAEREDLTSRLAVCEARRENQRLKLLELEDSLEAAQRSLDAAARTVSTAQEEIRVLSARREAFLGEEEDLRGRIVRFRQRREELQREQEALAPRIEDLRVLLSQAEERSAEAAATRQEAVDALREVRARLQSAQQTTLDLSASSSGSRQELESKRERREHAARKRDALSEHLQAFAVRQTQVEADRDRVEERLGDLEEQVRVAEEERDSREAARRSVSAERQVSSSRLQEAERTRAALASRLGVLQEQHERHAGFAAAVRRLLEERDAHPGLIGVVGEQVRVRGDGGDPASTLVVRGVLGERIQWVLVRNEEDAVSMMGRLREQGLGGVTFFPLEEAGVDPSGVDANGVDANGVDANRHDPNRHGLASSVLDLFDLEATAASGAARFLGAVARDTRLAASMDEARAWVRSGQSSPAYGNDVDSANRAPSENAFSRRAITPEGDVLEGDGVLRLAGGESEEAEILRREQEIPSLSSSLDALEEETGVLRGRIEGFAAEEEEHAGALRHLNASLDALERERRQASETRATSRTELAMLLEERTRLAHEQESLDEELSFLAEELLRLSGVVDRSSHDSAEAKQEFDALYQKAEALERERDLRVREASEREMEALRIRNDVSAEEARRVAHEREAGEIERALEEAESRLELRSREAEEAAERVEELGTALPEAEETRTARTAEMDTIRAAHQASRDALFASDAELKEQRSKLDSVVQTIHVEDVERVQIKSQADTIRDRIRTDFGIDLETYAPPEEVHRPARRRRGRPVSSAAADAAPADGNGIPGVESMEGEIPEGLTAEEAEDWDEDEDLAGEESADDEFAGDEFAGEMMAEAEAMAGESAAAAASGAGAAAEDAPSEPMSLDDRRARIAELKRAVEGMGNLNFLAEEEYRTGKERLEFHSKQAADLRQAREDLLEAIRRINETAGVMFDETFRAVQANFLSTFDQLFPGGEASLTLQEGDPLEGDIEIAARPRGKKLESIRLLSSGERALTAIALLFAIYLAKPSPLCLLDEVDAPLDDANLDRFLALVRHFSARTQFIVITHNKKTMETADRLFGVTMEEPGISKIVSVEMDGREARLAGLTEGMSGATLETGPRGHAEVG